MPRQEFLEGQRIRVLEAVAESVAEHGLRGTSAAGVAKRAGVSRATLTECFGSLDSCFLALLDWTLERVSVRMIEAFERESSWSDALLASLEALLAFLDSEPACARACLLEGMAGPSSELRLRAETLTQLGMFVDREARRGLPEERHPPAAMAQATVASVMGMLRGRLLSGEAPPFVRLLDQLAGSIVMSYLGPAAAADAARKGSERAKVLLQEYASRPVRANTEVPTMLRRVSAHRMRSCVRYLALNPGASNQDVGAGIGVAHPGQVSLLLARLGDAGLVVKECGGAGRPNAWRLSPEGVEVAQVLAHR